MLPPFLLCRLKQMEATRLSAAVHSVSVCHMSSKILVLLPPHCQGIYTAKSFRRELRGGGDLTTSQFNSCPYYRNTTYSDTSEVPAPPQIRFNSLFFNTNITNTLLLELIYSLLSFMIVHSATSLI